MPSRLVTALPALGVLRAAGPDARKFLQGQLSNDLNRLDAAPGLRAGLHSPQGRVIAVLQLYPEGENVLMVLPRDLAPTVAAHLGRYVLRAKLRIEDLSQERAVFGIESEGGVRSLVVAPAEDAPPEGDLAAAGHWQAADIAAGLAQVGTANSGHFVAQMLNLDHVDGISWTKGCYTGQEIIARAHYRGRVKRRLQRFATRDERPLASGDRVLLADGRTAEVTDVAETGPGRREFLAVTALPGAVDEVADHALVRLDAEPLPLPYALEPDIAS